MDYALVENYNQLVKSDDLVYFLGDMVMGDKLAGLAKIKQLNGKKVLLPGNHDPVHPMHNQKQIDKWKPVYSDAFDIIFGTQHPIQHWEKYTIKMSHFPDSFTFKGDDRYSPYRPNKDEADFILCGHVHDTWKTLRYNINVGVDVWDYKPVSQTQLLELMDSYEHVI